MLSAINKNGEQVILFQKSSQEVEGLREENFYCPICQEKVMIRRGMKVLPHFAHYKDGNCRSFGQGESEYHELGKKEIYQWLIDQNIDAKLEHYLPKIKQRPDILFKWNHRYFAIEFQCAYISEEILQNRTKGLFNMGIMPIWVLADKRVKLRGIHRFQFNEFEYQFFHYFGGASISPILYTYDPFKKLLKQFSNPFPIKSIVYGQARINLLRNISIDHLFQSMPLSTSLLYDYWLKEKVKFRTMHSKFISKEDRLFLKWLYSKGLHPQYLPSIIHLPVISHFIFKSSPYIWQSKLILDLINPLHIGDTISVNDLQTFEKEEIHRILIANVKLNRSPFLDYLNLLTSLGILEKVNDKLFRKIKTISFNKTLDEANHQDRFIINQLKGKIRQNELK